MALRSKHPHLYGQRIDVNGHIVQIGLNGIVTAPAHIESELSTQFENWDKATPADMQAEPLALPPPPSQSIQDVLAGQRALASAPLVAGPSQMTQLTEDRLVRAGAIQPPAAAVAPAAVAPPLAEPPLANQIPAQPIEPPLQPQVLEGAVPPTAPIQPPPAARPLLRGRAGKRADTP